MGFYLDKDTASNVVDYETTIWRERMIDVIDAVEAPGIKDPKAKAAFWLGLGFNAANHVFPAYTPNRVVNSAAGRAASTVLKRVALPVWIMSEVQKYFVDEYAGQLARANEELFARHTLFKDKLVDQVVGKARTFANSDYGRLISAMLVRHYQGHQFKDSVEARGLARDLLYDSGLIATDRQELRDIIAPGLEALVKKVELIANTLPSSPARTHIFSNHRQRLYYSASGDQEWVRWMGGPARTIYSDLVRITEPSDALRLMAYAYRMKVMSGSRVFPETSPYQVYTTTVVNQYPNRRLQDLIPSFEEAEPEVLEALRSAGRGAAAA